MRMTVEANGQRWVGETRPISFLLTDDSANAQDFSPAGSNLLVWSIEPDGWIEGINVPTINANGFGSVQGWNTEMGVTIEVLREEESQGDGTFQFLYQIPSEIRKLDYEEYFSKINTLQRQRYAEGADLPYTVDPIVVSTPLEYKLLAVVKTFDNK